MVMLFVVTFLFALVTGFPLENHNAGAEIEADQLKMPSLTDSVITDSPKASLFYQSAPAPKITVGAQIRISARVVPPFTLSSEWLNIIHGTQHSPSPTKPAATQPTYTDCSNLAPRVVPPFTLTSEWLDIIDAEPYTYSSKTYQTGAEATLTVSSVSSRAWTGVQGTNSAVVFNGVTSPSRCLEAVASSHVSLTDLLLNNPGPTPPFANVDHALDARDARRPFFVLDGTRTLDGRNRAPTRTSRA